ncbi:uncharacterized protein N7483_007242 [Penicillium malachiteum]|uniref:uncharacterized protein n=1 Tax=Penicillium malachiteum TaxID=1324776 RepID=UPI002547B2F0|nr:uncharacterized protein N7483_007242 [Penicillium malachiteum]KAJ5725885.1 hypothetical protein N7483_007242 [Penicillium malachiteum]
MSRSPLVLVLIDFLPVTYAYTTFDTNCTLPSAPDKINYISSPNTRGTLDILWSCLFTIISCTWTVQCPDLPTQRNEFKDGCLGWWKWAAKKYFSSAAWFLITMLAPEMLLGLYVIQAVRWRNYTKVFEKLGYANIDGVEWTRTHSCFAEMGGFVMKISKPSGHRLTQTTTEHADVTTHDLSLYVMKGQIDEMESHQKTEYVTLNCRQILALRKTGILERLPDISTDEIQDKSKADSFLRVITVIQILWLCVQTIARWVEGLAVTQLEIATVAFAICAVLMYHICWAKPKGVDIPITAFYYGGNIEEIRDRVRRAEEEVTPSVSGAQREWSMRLVHFKSTGMPGGGIKLSLTPSEQFVWSMTLILGGVVFGGIHLIAWNFVFPTHIEMVLWRVSALFCTFIIPASFFASLFADTGIYVWHWHGASLSGKIFSTFVLVILNLLGYFYVLARLFIIVEMFRTLAFQPIEAYVGTWTVNIPYVS